MVAGIKPIPLRRDIWLPPIMRMTPALVRSG
ncbi:hypothetical protein XVE_1658 [Xanthomonas vesicatoria ATCC 35937]|uniref:Uncharacterized protein n=1 Tax=Xanthomonas vesicatoria ATCC 35937 TaxID=925775 RepID=F0BC34_9XANT|nr:hypothetical protein XVE_1658 [Xanthomonas vesicatoria ATCC 35937]